MRLTTLVLVCAVLPVAGCSNSIFSTTQSTSTAEREPQGFRAWTDTPAPYEFAAGDKIKVQFELTPEMGEDAVVGPDGMISLRAAGQVQAEGQTVKQLQDAIARASAKTLVSPTVTVSLTETPGAPIFVGGAVTKPGAYTMVGRHGSFEAIQLAGGFSTEARMNEIVLIRRNPQNQRMLRTVDLRSLVEGDDEHPDVPLVSGDIVFVPRNKISEVDLWIDQYLNKFFPFTKAFAYSITSGGTR
jgi:protein involved in polysaccharide export with SLBB domain